MSTWAAFEADAPELAAFVRERLDDKVAYLATLRADGSPRVNPVGPWFAAGIMCIKMYPGSVKVRSLARDPHYALHSAVLDMDGTGGEAIVWGTAALIEDHAVLDAVQAGLSENDRYVFLAFDVTEVLVTTYEGDETVRRRWVSGDRAG
jgi:hypothetical protein